MEVGRQIEERVLILTPTGRDAELAREPLAEAGLSVEICNTLDELCKAIDECAGVAVIAEEVFDPAGIDLLIDTLRRQPRWSDFPLIILTSAEERAPSWDALRILDPVGNLTLLERPMRALTLLSAVQVALRARRRQYEVRRYLEERERREAALAAREAELRRALLAGDTGTWELDFKTGMVTASESTERLYGFEPMGRRPLEDYAERAFPEDALRLEQVIAGTARDYQVEYRIRLPDNRIRWIASRGEVLRDEEGNRIGLAGALNDITERKQAELTLRHRTWQLNERVKELNCLYSVSRLIEEHQEDVQALLDAVVEIIPCAFQFPGKSRARIRLNGDSFLSSDFEEAGPSLSASIRYRGQQIGLLEVFLVGEVPEGREPFVPEERALVDAIVERLTNALARKRALDALRESEDRWRAVTAALAEGVIVQDREGRITVSNPSAERILGLSREEMAGRTSEDERWQAIREDGTTFPAKEHPAMVALHRGVPATEVMGLKKAYGSVTWISVNSRPLMREDEAKPYGVVSSFVDITERKHAEEALRREVAAKELERRRLRTVLEALPVGVFIADAQGRLLEGNKAGNAVWGNPRLSERPEEYAKDFKGWWVDTGKRITSDEWALSRAVRNGETSVGEEIEIEAMDGAHRTILNYALPIRNGNARIAGAVVVNVDITERRGAEEELRRLAEIVESSYDAILRLSTDGCIVSWNIGAERMYGYRRAEVFGRHIAILLCPEREQEVARLLGSSRRGQRVEQYETECKRKDGRVIQVSLTISPIQNAAGTVMGASVVARDITERKRAEADRARLAAIVDASSDAILSKDLDGTITSWNHGAELLYGFTEEEAVGRPITIVVPPERADEEGHILGKIRHGERVVNFDTVRQKKNGELFDISLTVSPIFDGQGNIIGASTVGRDITERKQMEERLHYDAFHDKLTGLPNRSLFIDRLEHAIARAHRLGEIYAAFVLDVDNFKVINDSLGHLIGDKLLVQFSDRIQKLLRPVDTMGRFGGDEFTILLEEVEDRQAVEQVAERIQESLKEPFLLDHHKVHVGSSIGIAIGNLRYRNSDEVLRDADTALYEAKRRGKARHVVFDVRMRAYAVSRLQLESELRRAVARRELSVHYQPIVDVIAGRIVGCEALVRWYHPRLGFVEPERFIPVAEETGLIIPLGIFVLEKACRAVGEWLKQPVVPRDFYVSINLSPRQFFQGDLVGHVANLLKSYRLKGENLRVEITESVIMQSDREAAMILSRLRDQGVHVCMDDFGTGYSSLSYLHQFPVDVLKVDQSFIRGLTDRAASREIVKTVLGLANTLHMQSIAEGAETEGQLEEVKALGFRWVQGYALHRPMDREHFGALLTTVH